MDEPPPAVAFLTALWGPTLPPGTRIALWDKTTKQSHYLESPEEAAAFDGKVDVYCTASLVPAGLSASSRLKAQESKAIPGVWLDIDVNGGPEDKQNAAPTVEDAIKLAKVELAPTVLVNSGYGIQAWWLFDEPWVFTDEEERQQAARVTQGWHTRHLTTARRHGYRIDSTYDLARLMRLPGTRNGKGGFNVPVQALHSEGPRHRIEAAAEQSLAVAPLAVEQPALSKDFGFPMAKFDALKAANEQFARTWEHTRRDRVAEGWSTSEFDMALASFAVNARWTDDEVGALLREHRKKWGEEEKGQRRDYLERTIFRARSAIRKDERDQMQQRDLERITEGNPTIDQAFSIFNGYVFTDKDGNIPFVAKELVQYNSDPDEARYVLVMDDGREVSIGEYQNLRELRRLDKRIAPSLGHVMMNLKDSAEWREAVDRILKFRELREDSEPVLDWAGKYIRERMVSTDSEEAANTGAPFEEEGRVYVKPSDLSHYVRVVVKERKGATDLAPLLKKAGFALQKIHHGRERADGTGRRTTSSYWWIERSKLPGMH